jgi:hypothetical protein
VRIKPSTTTVPKIHDLEPPSMAMAPVLRWPAHWWESEGSPRDDSPSFPLRDELNYRGYEGGRLASVEFYKALKPARRLLVIDNYFDREHGLEPLCSFLETRTLALVRILSPEIADADIANMRDELFQYLRASLPRDVVPDVQWRNRIATRLPTHDRFAIVDDELWHFGATVGGAHPSVNAFSRGWSASVTKAEEHFDHLWGDR